MEKVVVNFAETNYETSKLVLLTVRYRLGLTVPDSVNGYILP